MPGARTRAESQGRLGMGSALILPNTPIRGPGLAERANLAGSSGTLCQGDSTLPTPGPSRP